MTGRSRFFRKLRKTSSAEEKSEHRFHWSFVISVFLLIFCLDKIFISETVLARLVHWKRFERISYSTRHHLFSQFLSEDLEKVKKGTRLILILGSSRSAAMNARQMQEKLDNTVIYNFSIPFPGPSYFYSVLEMFLEKGIRVDSILLEADEFSFLQDSLNYPFRFFHTFDFILKHSPAVSNSGFTFFDCLHFFEYSLFAVLKNPVDFGVLKEKRNPELTEQSVLLFQKANRERNGGIFETFAEKPMTEMELERDSDLKLQMLLQNERNPYPNISQLNFYRKILTVSAERNIPILVYSPPVSPVLKQKLHGKKKETVFVQRYLSAGVSSNVQWLNLSKEDFDCLEFEDSLHLNRKCSLELTARVLGGIPRK
ncbi:MAG TPA: DUF1574 family protein [Leptospiraceae bacterium]|nr:DUF1574 family protein [Leptospiraceae bacterium]HMY65181.1 DUF1574 family protein [Leptospiraceae bacterium]HMZ58094.1 DUF1574 family protein [Leptospiraceae bacterium]HNF24778.1 DUF1574 family protein [Leptospiraceae bacterium]HNH09052.1 DUF1574 family protein [Leptospiraceae bacterium]